MKKIFYLILILGYFASQNLTAQEHFVSPADSIAIDQQLDSHFGIDYEIVDYIYVDSLEDNSDYSRAIIDDEYGTLDNCIVFTAEKNTDNSTNAKGIVGVYKNGQIIWYSDYIIPDDEIYGGGFIYAIEDINNNGKLEIMTQWDTYGGASYQNKILYIHTWDGNQGSLIVDVSQGGSPIDWPDTKLFEIIDVQGDGVFEIVTLGFGNSPTVYEWNGSNYAYSETAQIDSTEMFFPRNNFTPIVKTKVTKANGSFVYEYNVKNSESSAQSINEFDVYGHDVSYKIADNYYFNVLKPSEEWYGDDRRNSVTWAGPTIKPGHSLGGFSFTAKGLPEIGYAYLRGYNYQWSGDYRENTSVKDYLNNSVIVKTIAAKLPPEPFVPLAFIDTLTTYVDSSYSLGWITNEQTKDKYNNYFTNTKNYLNQSNNNAAKTELQKVLTDCNTDSSSVLTSEAYALLYFNTDYLINRIPEGEPGLPVKLQDSQGNLLQGGSLQYYDGGWKDAIDNGNGTFTVQTERTTVSLKMHYAGGSQQKDNITVGADTVVFQTTDVTVKLLSSQNTLLDSGFVQYYASGWQDFGTLVNGTAHKELLSKNYTFKVKYAGSDKNKVQNLDTSTTVTFHTVNTEVQLQDSQGNLLNGGEAEYYASGWKIFGELTNGKVNKELLSRKYTFKVKYAGAENNLVQDLDSSTTVIFHTVNTTVQLKDSQGNLLDGGFAQYYAGGWQDFGAATNGVATKELLPKSYNFKMKYGGTDKDIVQDITNNSTVTFQTVNAEIQLRDSQGNLLDGGFAKYYASGWKDFGTAANGIAHKELLSRAYTFKIQYGGADINHVQNLDTNTTVVFNTINVTVQLKDSQGNLLDSGEVEYYASGWKTFGSVVNGTVTKELLPRTYTFKMIHGGLNTTKDQDVSVNSMVNFATTLTTVRVKDNQGQVVENAEALYYGGGWKQIGFTNATGEVSKELLGRTITFKAKKDSKEKNKQQDTSTNSVVEIILE